MPSKLRFVVGAGLIVLAIGYLITTAVRNTSEYYLTVNEVGARQSQLSGQMLRVAGRVKAGTISWDPATLTLGFAMVSPPNPDGSPVKPVAAAEPAEFRVIARGEPKPDMFAAGRDVIVEGRLASDGMIEARQVLTSCPSKYVPKYVPSNRRSETEMPLIGQLALALALMVAVYSIGANLLGIRRNSPDLLLSARHALWAMCAMVTVAVAALWTGLLTSDFSLEYVASYSSITLPIQYKVAALWGGQQGSLLFWTWLLSIFTSIAIFQNRRRNPEITPWALIVLAGVAIFFLGMLNFVTRPFDLLATVPPDGSDLNPLLQNYWMAIHPPSLYTGYVSAAVPFAFACGALVTRKLDDGWIRTTRRWAIFSWFFLTLGNLFGARWAYEVLGWGGYWAWDPVENAAFMPWLVMTAYLHSVMIQERKDMLKVWNLALIGMAFMLTLFGTFLTRSGVISSVHSFTQSGLGPYFLTFLIVVVVGYTALLISRVKDLKSPAEFESYLSREAAFLFNNLMLVGIAFAVFWGTVFPVISEAVRGVKITVGPPFFNKVNGPLALGLVFLMGVGPLIAWRRTSPQTLMRTFLAPLTMGVGRRGGRVRDGPAAMVRADGAFAGGVRARHRGRRVPPRRERAAPSGA